MIKSCKSKIKNNNLLNANDNRHFGGGGSLKLLSAALLAGCALLGCGQTFANDVSDSQTLANQGVTDSAVSAGTYTVTDTAKYIIDKYVKSSDKATVHTLTKVTRGSYSGISLEINGVNYNFVPTEDEDKAELAHLTNIGRAYLTELPSADGAMYSIENDDGTTSYYGYKFSDDVPPLVSSYTLNSVDALTDKVQNITTYDVADGVATPHINDVSINKDYAYDYKSTTLGDKSAYTLSPAAAEGENTITTYRWNNDTFSLDPVYYDVNIKESIPAISKLVTYGEGEYTLYSKWDNSAGYPVLQDATVDDGTLAVRYDRFDSSKVYTTKYDSQMKNLGTSSSFPSEVINSIVNNSTTTELNDVLFSGNTVKGVNSGSTDTILLGGALYNSGTITNLKGAFIENLVSLEATTGNVPQAAGGAIMNTGKIDNIEAGFYANVVQSFTSGGYQMGGLGLGGAICNAAGAEIGKITGDFLGNSADTYAGVGGAIYNEGTIGDINGSFIRNNVSSVQRFSSGYGGAISNVANFDSTGITLTGGTINRITGLFYQNRTSSDNSQGGAIWNNGTIKGGIDADFIGNTALGATNVGGGAIYNEAQLGSDHKYYGGVISHIKGDFIGNNAMGNGGAIFNKLGKIGDITGNFVGNTAIGGNGAAIYNHYGTLDNITGNFINNTSEKGVIYNYGEGISDFTSKIGHITGDFINNKGGAIYSGTGGVIGNITGDFINNTGGDAAISINHGFSPNPDDALHFVGDITGNFIGNRGSKAGAIYISDANYNNDRDIYFLNNNIKGNFVNNYSESDGGGVNLKGLQIRINSIIGDFIGNHAEGLGGAIAKSDGMYARIGLIKGDFIGNSAIQGGGAIYSSQYESIDTIEGDFIGNTTDSLGGAIYSFGGGINHITGDFIANSAVVNGGAIAYNGSNYATESIIGDFIANSAGGNGGAIFSANNTIKYIKGNFIENTASNGSGGAIFAVASNRPINIYGDFYGNTATNESGNAFGGAIYTQANSSEFGNLNGNFVNNHAVSTSGTASGGAVYLICNMDNVIGDYIGNYAKSENGVVSGGALFSPYVINNLVGSYIGNYVESNSGTASGGAIYQVSMINYLDIKKLNNNHAISNGGAAQGGAMYIPVQITNGKIGEIKNNYVEGAGAQGGAIFAPGSVYFESITGDITGNYAKSSSASANGGALFLPSGGTINELTGNITDNYAEGAGDSTGGAIHGSITINNLDIDKLNNNHVLSTKGNAQGGATFQYGGSITGTINEVANNYVEGAGNAQGGAMFISGTSLNVDIGKLSNNHATSTDGAAIGGAIHYSGNSLKFINSAFKDNYAKALNDTAHGGAIVINGLATIQADNGQSEFSGNYVEDSNGKRNEAIYIQGGLLTFDSTNNGTITLNDYVNGEKYQVTLTDSNSSGTGVINLYNDIFNSNVVVTQNNININTSDSKIHEYQLNAIQSSEDARWNIDMNLSSSEQYADTFALQNGGEGKIYLSGLNVMNDCEDEKEYILQIIKSQVEDAPQLDFDNSHVKQMASAHMTSEDVLAKDVFLATTDTTNDSIGIIGARNLLAAWAEVDEADKSFEIKNGATVTLSRDADFKGETVKIIGGNGTIDLNNKQFITEVKDTQDIDISDVTIKGAKDITNKGNLDLTNVSVDSSIANNATLTGGGNLSLVDLINNNNSTANIRGDLTVNDLVNEGTLDVGKSLQAKTITNSATANIAGNLTADNVNNSGTVDVKGNLTSNEVANSGTAEIAGDLSSKNITNSGTLNIGKKVSANNITNDGAFTAGDDFNADVVVNNNEINLNNGNVTVNKITAANSGELKLTDVIFNSSGVVENQNISALNTTLNISNPYNLKNDSLIMDNSTANLGSLTLAPLKFNNFAMNNSTMNIQSVNVDLATETMGRITAHNYGDFSGTVNVNSLNVANDGKNPTTNVLFADNSNLAGIVKYNGSKEVLSKIYKYNVGYKIDENDGNGYFQFVRGTSSNNPGVFSPAALTPLAADAGAKSVMNESLQYAYEHADGFTQLPAADRFAKIHQNEYALSTDFNYNLGSYNYEQHNNSAWVKPFATFENIPLKNGPKLDAITYGTLVGYDGDFKPMKNGWHRIGTGYIGYNGAQVDYSGTNSTLNGGLLGLTETFYRGNFWTAWTVSAGATVGETHTMYGHDNFTSLMAGVGTKTGYNFEFKEGRYIIQPVMNLSYTFVNTFDYTNAAGVRMNMDPNHSIQIHPMVRFIANYNNGWQPYIRVGMVWNAMGETQASANGIRLPESSVKPYVEYGVGIQRQWKDKFTAYLQTMIRNGGRNGISLTTGFRWALGKEGDSVNHQEKVILPQTKIKLTNGQLDYVQITSSEENQSLHSVASESKMQSKVIKQLPVTSKVKLGAKQPGSTKTSYHGVLKQL